jgi:hypothetical protein
VILRLGAGSDGTLNVLASGPVDRERYDTLTNLDLRLARNTKIGKVTLTPSVELFNVFNNDVVLGVLRQATSANFRRVDDVVSPRILRIGARVSFEPKESKRCTWGRPLLGPALFCSRLTVALRGPRGSSKR